MKGQETAEEYQKKLQDADDLVEMIKSAQTNGASFREALTVGKPDLTIEYDDTNETADPRNGWESR